MMQSVNSFFLHAGFAGFSLVVVGFISFVPFYRTLIGWVLFGVNVNFWLILLLAVLLQHGWDRAGFTAVALRSILYPSTAFCGFTLFILMLREQIVNRKHSRLEANLFSHEDHPTPHQ